MTEFFATLFEFWGLSPISPNLGYNMRGWDCENEVSTTVYYDVVGFSMLGVSLAAFFFFYFLKDSPRFNQRKHWLIVFMLCFVVLFITAFSISNNIFTSQNFTCENYPYSFSDIMSFAFAAGFWGAVFFLIWSLVYRMLGMVYPSFQNVSINTRNTPWKQ